MFYLIVYLTLLLDYEFKTNQYSSMNIASVAVITLIATLSLYLIFLVLGVGGIANNRAAQGLDQNKKSDE